MRCTINEKGAVLFNKFENYYYDELERLRKEKNDPDYCEGWCIIDDSRFVSTLEDLCGLIIYGDDEYGIDLIKEFIDKYGENEEYGYGYTAKEVYVKLFDYYTIAPIVIKNEKWDRESIRQLCIREKWYTHGVSDKYNEMLERVENNEPTTENIFNIALDIIIHSNMDINNETIEHVMFMISKYAVDTFYEIRR